MWKDSIRNIVVIFQPNILRIVGSYVRHWANNILTPQRTNFITELTPIDSKKLLDVGEKHFTRKNVLELVSNSRRSSNVLRRIHQYQSKNSQKMFSPFLYMITQVMYTYLVIELLICKDVMHFSYLSSTSMLSCKEV